MAEMYKHVRGVRTNTASVHVYRPDLQKSAFEAEGDSGKLYIADEVIPAAGFKAALLR